MVANGRSIGVLVGALGLVTVLSGCGLSFGGGTEGGEPSIATSTATEAAPAEEGAASESSAPDAQETTENKNSATESKSQEKKKPKKEKTSAKPEPEERTGPYPGAGGPIPPNARQVGTVKTPQYGGPVAVFQSPTGNIKCAMSQDGTGCGLKSYWDEMKYGTNPGGQVRYYVDIPRGEVIGRGDPPPYARGALGAEDTVVPEVVNYGEVVVYGNQVCASEFHGMTCWDSTTGRGAFMNRAGTEFFG